MTRISFALLLLAAHASADDTAYHCEAPATPIIVPILDDNACVGYELHAADGSITKTVKFPFTGSGKLIASADGRTVIMLQSYLPGTADAQGNIVEGIGAKARPDPVGVYVYRDGARVTAHKISRVMKRKELVERSISHVDWIREAPAVLGVDSFTLTTTSYRDITFDTKTGAITHERDAGMWTRCDDIVAGKLDVTNGQLLTTYSLKTRKRSPAIAFLRDPKVALTHKASATVCLERRQGALVVTELL